MSHSNSYYKTCEICSQQFSVKYFNRHVCDISHHVPDDEGSNQALSDLEPDEGHHQVFDENALDDIDVSINDQSIDTSFTSDVENNDYDTDQSENSIYGDDYFEDLLQESFIDMDYENLPINVLLRWIVLFLAKWQKSFNITDSSLQLLLKFLAIYIHTILKENLEEKFIDQFKKDFPKTIYSFRKSLSINAHTFKKFVVCFKCNALYPYNDCLIRRGETVSKECSFVRYPEHPQSQHRRKCGQLLMKESSISPGNFMPFKTYCYQPIKKSLQLLLNRPNFELLCEKWKDFNIPEDVMSDVYDGKIWRTFSKDDEWFFERRRSYGLMLNCDWFQPFKHISSFSIGAVYAVILNLPRHLQFKRENLILVSIIPDMPKEPPTNSFLEPLVEELKEAWTGFQFFSSISKKEEVFRLALLCVGCDIPASRKLCGFLGHSATRGCSKCNKQFPGQVWEKNYGGFDMSLWEPRTNQEHRNQMMRIVSTKTQQDQNHFESLYGTRFSVLALLPYFDTVRMSVIDPMHNLFLGTAKNLIKIWKERGYLNKAALQNIQTRADSFTVPSDIGKAPRKIISGFDNFNADEYKNWTLLFSLFLLADVIPKRDLECFRKFVLACHYLCRKSISKIDVTIAHGLLQSFCQLFEQLYGEQRVTPNMHLHLHLKECILDFGPIYSFWLFSFERYNGMLGNLPHNKRNIEVQIMSRFCGESMIDNVSKPEKYHLLFDEIFKNLELKSTERGTLHDIECQTIIHIGKLSSRLTDVSTQLWYKYSDVIQPLQEMQVCAFSHFEKDVLSEVYRHLYPHIDLERNSFCYSYEKVHDIKIIEQRFSSYSSRNRSSSYVLAFWPDINGNIKRYQDMGLLPHPGKIKYFVKHSLIIDNRNFVHWFAAVDWLLPVEDDIRFKFGKPIELWYRSLTVQYGPCSYIPVSRLYSKFIHCQYNYRSKDLIVVIPRIYTTMS